MRVRVCAWRENSLPRFAYNYVCYITNCILGEILMFRSTKRRLQEEDKGGVQRRWHAINGVGSLARGYSLTRSRSRHIRLHEYSIAQIEHTPH